MAINLIKYYSFSTKCLYIVISNDGQFLSSYKEDDVMGRHKYDGGWAFGLQEGQGVMTFRSGDIYQGKFKENVHHLYIRVPKSNIKNVSFFCDEYFIIEVNFKRTYLMEKENSFI